MSQLDTDSRPTELRDALEHAQRLVDSRPRRAADSPTWSARAAHVGDMTILALAMRG